MGEQYSALLYKTSDDHKLLISSLRWREGKAIPVTGRGGLVEGGGSHIFQTFGSQVTVRLSALRANRP
jgi:hypothetical protein